MNYRTIKNYLKTNSFHFPKFSISIIKIPGQNGAWKALRPSALQQQREQAVRAVTSIFEKHESNVAIIQCQIQRRDAQAIRTVHHQVTSKTIPRRS